MQTEIGSNGIFDIMTPKETDSAERAIVPWGIFFEIFVGSLYFIIVAAAAFGLTLFIDLISEKEDLSLIHNSEPTRPY